MLTTSRKARLSSALLPAVLGLVVGCGGGDDAGNRERAEPVARVGDVVITKQAFDHWMRGAKFREAYRPPRSGICREFRRTLQPTEGDQRSRPLRPEVVEFLVQAEWVNQEAKARGLNLRQAEIQRMLRDSRAACFSGRAYEHYLRGTGQTDADVLFRFRVTQLTRRLTRAAVRSAPAVSEQDIVHYYERRLGGPSSGRTLADVRIKIREVLELDAKRKALHDFIESFRREYKPKTTCAPGYFVANECGRESPL
jgi:hypothetical protein